MCFLFFWYGERDENDIMRMSGGHSLDPGSTGSTPYVSPAKAGETATSPVRLVPSLRAHSSFPFRCAAKETEAKTRLPWTKGTVSAAD